MPLRPRHGPPPYQVMKACPPTPPSSGRSLSASADSGAGSLTQRLSQSIAFRMTRRQLALILLILLMLIVLAYWVGHSLGYRQAQAEQAADLASLATPQNLGDARSVASQPPPMAPATTGQIKLAKLTGQADARQPGLNYFVMIAPTETYAVQVLAFLSQQGLDAQAVQRHNSRSFKLVFLRGLAKTDLDKPARREYEQTILRLGRMWKATSRNNKDFSGLYLEEYRNESVSLVITREKRP